MASLADKLPERALSVPVRTIPWTGIAWFSLLLIAGSYPIFRHLVEQWATDEDVNHGFLVPLVAAWIAWERREKILAVALKPSWWGIAVMIWGAVQGCIGMLGAELFLQRTSILILLVGLLLTMGGAPLVRVLAFPLLLLPFMIPIPNVIYNRITFPCNSSQVPLRNGRLTFWAIRYYATGTSSN